MRYKYWGWIPILTRSLCFESGPDERQELVESEAAGTDIVTDMLLKMGYIQNGNSYIKNETLTDYYSERAVGIRYQLIITDVAKIIDIIELKLAIGRPSYIRSLITIHDGGF